MFGFFARTGVAALAVLGACLAHGQSFNVDLDLIIGSFAVGVGVPSDEFGAAASQPGRWNKIDATGHGPYPLLGLSGSSTNVTITGPLGGLAGGNNNPSVSGDYAFLMKDGRSMAGQWTFAGLSPGQYRLFTYACPPNGDTYASQIIVINSSTSNPQVVTGPILPNQFALGITHAFHDVSVGTSGVLAVSIDGTPGGHAPFTNGFQLVLIPEPGTLTAFFTLTLLLSGRLKKKPFFAGSKESDRKLMD